MKHITQKQSGIALFVAILMSVSIALLASASSVKAQQAVRISVAHQRRAQLRLFATDAAKFALANIQSQINVETANIEELYIIEGTSEGEFILYPNDANGAKRPLFGYRAIAKLVGVPGDILPGMATGLATDNYCFDIVTDIREVLEINSTVYIDAPQISGHFYWGKAKSIGMVACIPRQLDPIVIP